MRRLLPVSVLAVCLSGCARHAQPISGCAWPQETKRLLDLSRATGQRHLSDDAEFAEDLAIRYADARSRPGEGEPMDPMGEYARTREQCMATLFESIAKSHGVTPEQVRGSINRRRHQSLDWLVIVSFAGIYGLAARGMARLVWRRFPPAEGRLAGVVATVLISAVFSLAGLLLGELWSIAAETLRVSNGHLSYRADRIPWNHHRPVIFAGCIAIFLTIAGLCARSAGHAGDSDVRFLR